MNKEILFTYFPKNTYRRYQDLLAAFSSLDNAWQAHAAELRAIGWPETLAHEFIHWRNSIDIAAIEHTLFHESISTIALSDPDYPYLLRQIADPPLCLFVRGTIPTDPYPVAVVGTRTYTGYGKQITESIVEALVRHRVTIVSGLALGIDGFAHETTLTHGGKTVAVLGGGIDQASIAPREHQHLAQKIIRNGGAVISEYPPQTLPTKYSFPKRNRIIAGLSLGTLVVEARDRSGALITASVALEYNREVFAVPQNITSPTSSGPNTLLKLGAHVVTSATDILDVLNIPRVSVASHSSASTPASSTDNLLLSYLSHEPVHIDELIKRTGLPSQTVMSALTILELDGRVRNLGSMMYVLLAPL